jgi:hypothetical protein
MKIDLKIILSMLAGAALLWLFQRFDDNQRHLGLINQAMATQNSSVKVDPVKFSYCELFFSDDRDYFETEINKRLKKAQLLQSNVIWSETTKQLGFYAMVCY